MAAPIPCKRPKVTIELVAAQMDGHRATCHVPGCAWFYPAAREGWDDRLAAPKVAAEEEARWHRQQHRAAVPDTKVVHDVEWDVYCQPCGGHRRTFGTRAEAKAWLEEHLVSEHGLVAC